MLEIRSITLELRQNIAADPTTYCFCVFYFYRLCCAGAWLFWAIKHVVLYTEISEYQPTSMFPLGRLDPSVAQVARMQGYSIANDAYYSVAASVKLELQTGICSERY